MSFHARSPSARNAREQQEFEKFKNAIIRHNNELSIVKDMENKFGAQAEKVKAAKAVADKAFLKEATALMEEGKKGKKAAGTPTHADLKFHKICRSGARRKTKVVLSHAHDWVLWDHTGALSFVKNRHSNRLEVAHIHKVETGQENINFFPKDSKGKSGKGMDELSRAFVLVGPERSLKVICPDENVCNLWIRATKLLIENIKSGPTGNPFFQYLDDQWNRADTDRSGTLSVKEIMAIMRKMNVTKSKKEIQQDIQTFDDDHSGQLDKAEYTKLMEKIFSDRKEVKRIIVDLQKQTKGNVDDESVSIEMLKHFYNVTQRGGRGNQEEVDEEFCAAKIREITRSPDATELSLLDFAMLLDSGDNSVFDEKKASRGAGTREEAYMSRPLSHYWINSSHNTYLSGDQLKGHSSSEQYTYVLQRGCRCVELDCWDGDESFGNQPIITHGHTLCTKILFKDVIETIDKNAFGPPANNEYPVILSIEMHCSVDYQNKMWKICKEYFGNKILVLPTDEDSIESLPSPWELRNKIIIKGKRLKPPDALHAAPHLEESDSSDDDEAGGAMSSQKSRVSQQEAEAAHKPAKKEKKKVKIDEEWSKGVYLAAVHFKSFDLPGKPFEMSSYSEKKCKKLCGDEPARLRFIQHNYRQLSRVYPFGGRIDSSNLQPINAWASGCQLVALNFQTGDLAMQLNYGKFIENGNTGYVLKPPYMRETGVKACEVKLDVEVLSCQRLPNNNASRDIFDPYVRVEVYGVDEDESLNQKTESIDNNGFNPCFKKGQMHFTIKNRETAMLRISVLDEDIDQDDFIGQFCLPVTCIRNGYRHVPLYDANNGLVQSAGVLCNFSQNTLKADNYAP